jgi:hypothetical protein
MTQEVATETTVAMTKAARVVATEMITATRALAVRVEVMETTPTQEAEIISRVPQVEGKARLNKRESKPLRALLRVKDGRRPFLPFDFKTEVDVVWWIFTKNFIVLSSCIIIE